MQFFTREDDGSDMVDKYCKDVEDELRVARGVEGGASCAGGSRFGECEGDEEEWRASPRTGPRREPVKTVGSMQHREG